MDPKRNNINKYYNDIKKLRSDRLLTMIEMDNKNKDQMTDLDLLKKELEHANDRFKYTSNILKNKLVQDIKKSKGGKKRSPKISRKSKKVSRKSKKVSRKSKKVSRKVSRKSKKVSRKSRKALIYSDRLF